MIRFKEVERKVECYFSDADLDLLRRAYIYSAKEHKGQVRVSGEPYLIHPLSVADILADMRLDVATISSGLLHDVLEDSLTTPDNIRNYFGDEIAHLVDSITKVTNLVNKMTKLEAHAENLRKMVLAMVDDIRVVLVKLADCLHNMRMPDHLKPEKRKRLAQETREIYAPIAHRLGMGKIRAELEDLAFQYLEPEEYKWLDGEVEKRRASTEAFLDEIKTCIAEHLNGDGVPFVRIEGRIKRLYSIYLKMKRLEIDSLDQVYDLAAVRVITNKVPDCYDALAVIHQYWSPANEDEIKNHYNDYIEKPRENKYQSLHTRVWYDKSENQVFEVQIRTEEMHRIAEEGIAAHWKYKEGKGKDTSEDEAMNELRQRVTKLQEDSDMYDSVDYFKLSLYGGEIYALTPLDDVIKLPREATPVDFAYAIHTEVGDQCTRAKVNDIIKPLNYQIQNGDKIKIIKTPGHRPNRDWLNFVVTAKARNKIRSYVAKEKRAEKIEEGRKKFEQEATRLRVKVKNLLFEDRSFGHYLADNGYSKVDDLFAAIGYGKVNAETVLARFAPEAELEGVGQAQLIQPQQLAQTTKGSLYVGGGRITIRDVDNVLCYFAPCCKPVHGEEIIGYITRGKGVSVHAKRCKNIAQLITDHKRIIEVTWSDDNNDKPSAIKLPATAEDKQE